MLVTRYDQFHSAPFTARRAASGCATGLSNLPRVPRWLRVRDRTCERTGFRDRYQACPVMTHDRPTGYFGLVRAQLHLQEILGCTVDLGTPDSFRPAMRAGGTGGDSCRLESGRSACRSKDRLGHPPAGPAASRRTSEAGLGGPSESVGSGNRSPSRTPRPRVRPYVGELASQPHQPMRESQPDRQVPGCVPHHHVRGAALARSRLDPSHPGSLPDRKVFPRLCPGDRSLSICGLSGCSPSRGSSALIRLCIHRSYACTNERNYQFRIF